MKIIVKHRLGVIQDGKVYPLGYYHIPILRITGHPYFDSERFVRRTVSRWRVGDKVRYTSTDLEIIQLKRKSKIR